MYFVYRTESSKHGNGQRPDWALIDFKGQGLRTAEALGTGRNGDWIWGKDIYQEIKSNPEAYLIVEAKDYDHLQMTKEYKEKWNEFVKSAIVPESRLGWVAPDGTFIGCRYYDHSFIAEEYLHSDEKTLEDEGWCKLYVSTWGGRIAADDDDIRWFTKNQRLTVAQQETLKRHVEKHGHIFGFIPNEDYQTCPWRDNDE